MNRMSSLPIAQFCSMSGKLFNASGPAAAQSTAYHARAAHAPESLDLLHRLPKDERDEALSWPLPQTTKVLGHDLDYRLAVHEATVALTADLEATAEDSDGVATVGHVDAYWPTLLKHEGQSIVAVCDLKRSQWTSSLSSLQLHAYGWALAQLCGADGYIVGIYVIRDAEWVWPNEPTLVNDLESLERANELRAAITNTDGEATTGPHCDNCWSRAQCPAHALPAASVGDSNVYNSIARDGVTKANASRAVSLMASLKTTLKTLENNLRVHVDVNGGIVSGDKEWRKCGGGKKSSKFDHKSFAAAEPELVAPYMVDYVTAGRFQWTNAKKK